MSSSSLDVIAFAARRSRSIWPAARVLPTQTGGLVDVDDARLADVGPDDDQDAVLPLAALVNALLDPRQPIKNLGLRHASASLGTPQDPWKGGWPLPDRLGDPESRQRRSGQRLHGDGASP
jgi:hypothetical protein